VTSRIVKKLSKKPNLKPRRGPIRISRSNIYKDFRICGAICVIYHILKYMEVGQSDHITILKKNPNYFAGQNKTRDMYTSKDQKRRSMQ